MLFKLSTLEIFILEMIVWFGLWMINDYTAMLLTAILVPIVSAILIIALISELMERTKISRKYFRVMFISILAPLLAAGMYMVFFGGTLDFVK